MKVRTDLNLIKTEWCDIPLLFPALNIKNLWLKYYHDEQVEKWLEVWKYKIYWSEIKDCDYVVFPKNYDLKYLKSLRNISKIAKKYNKKVIVFYMSDEENKLPHIENLIVFRSSMNSNNPSNEYPMPWFPEDLINYCNNPYNNIVKDKPSIWYVGYYAYYSLITKIRYYVYKILMYIVRLKPINYSIYLFFNYIYPNEHLYNYITIVWSAWTYRKSIIDILKKEKRIKFNFIERKRWWTLYEKDSYRKEYIDNMINSDFPLVIRWRWNFSFRLSEVISLWKIPIFIDTDCILPFSDKIDYKELFILIPYSDRNNLYDYIKKYMVKNWNKLGLIQKEIRQVYEEYYTLTGFYMNIIEHILKTNN